MPNLPTVPPAPGTTGPYGIPEPVEAGIPAAQATLEQAWRRLMQRYSVHNIDDLKAAGTAIQAMRTIRRTG